MPPTAPPPVYPPGRPVYLLASWEQRFRAYAIDGLLVFVPTLAVWAVLLPGLVARAGRDEQLQSDFDTLLDASNGDFPIGRFIYWATVIGIVAGVAYWVVIGIYSAVFMSRTAGQTPGRKAVGIRVMRVDGKPITFWWAFYRTTVIREGLFGIGSFLSGGILYFLQYLWPLWDGQRRTLHDMVARSRVVVDAEDQR